jgi:hypothetical protein
MYLLDCWTGRFAPMSNEPATDDIEKTGKTEG